MPEDQHCGNPCEPGDPNICEECEAYWARMVEEGFWRDGEWTDRGMRDILRHA